MACKTPRGQLKKELTGDGRENPRKHIDREFGVRKQTKTKIKRAKKNEKAITKFLRNS